MVTRSYSLSQVSLRRVIFTIKTKQSTSKHNINFHKFVTNTPPPSNPHAHTHARGDDHDDDTDNWQWQLLSLFVIM